MPALRAGDGAGVGSEERLKSDCDRIEFEDFLKKTAKCVGHDPHRSHSLLLARSVRARSSCAPEVLGDILEAVGGILSGSGSRLDRGGIFSALSQPH